jgi:MoxR-like ATPase
VGKTELAKTTAALLDLPLIRLQCYEGLDEAKALYEWKYGKQLLYTQVLKEKLGDLLHGAKGLAESMERLHHFGDIFYSEDFLEPRPLLKALHESDGSILLIDEVEWTSQTTSSNRSCSRYSPTTRYPSPRSAPSGRRARPWCFSPATIPGISPTP